MLVQCLSQSIEEGTIVLQLDGIDGTGGLGGVAHVFVAIRLQLPELTIHSSDFAPGFGHGAAQVVRRGCGDLLNRFESFGLHHRNVTIGRLPWEAPRTASRVASDPRNFAPFPPVRTCPDAGIRAFSATARPPGPPARPNHADRRPR